MRLQHVIRRAPTTARNAVRDLRYGAFLGGTIATRFGDAGAHDVGNADYDDIALLFSHVDVRPDDVLVDVGTGKGRPINWFLSRYPRNRVVGIELDPDICARTARRLRRHANVTVLCGDATELVPVDGTVFFLFNPFTEQVLRRFVETVLAQARPRRIVYHNAKFLHVFLDDPRFEVEPLEVPPFHSALVSVRGTNG